MKKKINLIGIGMNGPRTMTAEALEAVRGSQVLIGAKRMTEAFSELEKPVFTAYAAGEIAAYIASCPYENVAVLLSGDCGFYSGAKKLLPLLAGYDTKVFGGIASPVYFCAKLGMPWEDVFFVSLHGTKGNVVRTVCAHEKTFFLLGKEPSPKEICSRLCEYGQKDVEVYIGEDLGGERERITKGTAESLISVDTDPLCVMLVKNDAYERCKKSCISDDAFFRGKTPMTKAEVRSICVAKLRIGPKDICWDVGCGTGSVSVEMAFCCEQGKVYAVERNEEAVALTDKNRRLFGCDNIEIIHGEAGAKTAKLPAPDCVFVGGSGGQLGLILKTALEKNPAARMVVTAVSLETLLESADLFAQLGLEAQITQMAVTRTKKAGSHTMLSAENPVFIISGGRKASQGAVEMGK